MSNYPLRPRKPQPIRQNDCSKRIRIVKRTVLILAGLALGTIDRSLFTSNANFYFGQTALDDYRQSLAPIGPLESLTRSNETLRGGMTHRTYRAAFQKKTVNLNVYLTPEGKYEEFLVEEMFLQ